jgi:hypothetical protein
MELHYLDFDASDDGHGGASFDAMAAVPASRWPALLAEASALLAWAHATFGAPGALEDGAAWDYALHGVQEASTSLELDFDVARAAIEVEIGEPAMEPRMTLSLTLSGSEGVADALRDTLMK